MGVGEMALTEMEMVETDMVPMDTDETVLLPMDTGATAMVVEAEAEATVVDWEHWGTRMVRSLQQIQFWNESSLSIAMGTGSTDSIVCQGPISSTSSRTSTFLTWKTSRSV